MNIYDQLKWSDEETVTPPDVGMSPYCEVINEWVDLTNQGAFTVLDPDWCWIESNAAAKWYNHDIITPNIENLTTRLQSAYPSETAEEIQAREHQLRADWYAHLKAAVSPETLVVAYNQKYEIGQAGRISDGYFLSYYFDPTITFDATLNVLQSRRADRGTPCHFNTGMVSFKGSTAMVEFSNFKRWLREAIALDIASITLWGRNPVPDRIPYAGNAERHYDHVDDLLHQVP